MPISASDVFAYCQLSYIPNPDDCYELFRFVRVLDRVYLKDFYDKRERELNKIKNKNKASAGRR